MSAFHLTESKSANRLAFEHYLRTGERLTSRQWRARYEQKFNPYHDRLGRFTTASGATATAGYAGARIQAARATAAPSRQARREQVTRPVPDQGPVEASPGRHAGSPTSPRENGFQSRFILDRVESRTSNADSYFELNKRQVQLDLLRKEAGPNPHPTIKADLEEFQRRLDDNRRLLDERQKIADRSVIEIVRAGFAPADIAAGAANIAAGNAELRDYLSVATAIPLGAAFSGVGRMVSRSKVPVETFASVTRLPVQLGGPYRTVRKLRGYHAHHLIADSISPIPKAEGASIAMMPDHHIKTGSYGSRAEAVEFRIRQKALLDMGDHAGALKMGIDDVRSKFGDVYDGSIQQAISLQPQKGAK